MKITRFSTSLATQGSHKSRCAYILSTMWLGISLIVLCPSVWAVTTSNWTGAQDSNFDNAGNWNNGIPTDIAAFGAVSQTSVSIGFNPTTFATTELNGLTFNSGAAAYTITVPGDASGYYYLMLDGPGITNNSSNVQTIHNDGGLTFFNNTASAAGATIINQNNTSFGETVFDDSSTAGNANISNANSGLVSVQNNATLATAIVSNRNGGVDFYNSAHAGFATINNTDGGGMGFYDNSTADHANITNSSGSVLNFYDSSTSGRATITNSAAISFSSNSYAGGGTITNNLGGVTTFSDDASMQNQSVIDNNGGSTVFMGANTTTNSVLIANSGGTVDISSMTSSGLEVDSISGAGLFNLGSKTLTVGNNNTSETVSGTIRGGGGSLIKIGTGILTLSGSNTYSGATQINQGTVQAGANNSLSNASAVVLANTAGATLDLNGYNETIGSLSGGGTLGGNVTLGAGTLAVGNDNTSTSYAGVISGSGALTKIGTGTLTLTGNNTYGGGTNFESGVLNVSNDVNLGVSTGTLTFANGGILQTGAAMTSARHVQLNAGGGTIDTNGWNSTFSGTIAGTGSLTKINTGTLTLSGENTYAGTTLINAGTLQAGASNSLSNASAVVLANTAGAILDVNGYDETIGSLSGGGPTGGNVILGTGVLTTGYDNTSTIFAGTLRGLGSLIKIGTGTQTLTGNSTMTGPTTINGGTLELDGSLAGSVAVAPGGELSGTGTLGGLTNRGIVSPATNGNLTASSYSGAGNLDINFDATSHAMLNVIGTATIAGGTLNIIGSHFVTGQYEILTATSVIGTFSTVNAPSNTVFFNFTPKYTPIEVDLGINALSFLSVAESDNERKLALSLDSEKGDITGAFATVINALSSLSTVDEAHDAYHQLSGDSLASFQNTAFRNAEVFTNQMNDRAMTGGFATTASLLAPVQVDYNTDSLEATPTTSELHASTASTVACGLWSRGVGFFDHTNSNSSIGSPSSDDTTGGFQAGYDFLVNEDVLFGFSGGYAKTSLSVDDRDSSGNTSAVQTGVYASYLPGNWFLNGSLAYMTASNEMTRSIQFPGVDESASSNFTSRAVTTFVEAGYNLNPEKSFSLQPSVSLRQTHLHQSDFTEYGAPDLDLAVQDQTVNSLVSALGARISRQYRENMSYPITLGARAAWQHELETSQDGITAEFVEAPGNAFSVQSTPRSRNAAALGLNGTVNLSKNLKGFTDYSVTLGSGQDDQEIQGGLSVTW